MTSTGAELLSGQADVRIPDKEVSSKFAGEGGDRSAIQSAAVVDFSNRQMPEA